MGQHFRSLSQAVYVLAAALVVPAVWSETLPSTTKVMADRVLSAANPYVLDTYGIVATAPDFDGLISEVQQGIADKSHHIEFSTEMTAFIADSPQRRELVMRGEFSAYCSITPSEYLDDYQQARGQLKEEENQNQTGSE